MSLLGTYLDISVPEQTLTLINDGEAVGSYRVSTARNGVGERRGSECTPRGWHIIRAKIGSGLPINTVFKGRRPTGEIFDSALGNLFPGRDWILTRILWLGGLEPGINRYGEVDTCWRYIYIHGTSDESMIGTPASHGCIRMNNAELLDLFERVSPGQKVYIHE
ncbi:hypothetical protein MCAMS1_01562 [biofilm metagenome]